MQTNVGPYLAQLNSLVPQSVKDTLKPQLGAGTSPFGTPSLKDMLGSVGGVHTADFNNANTQLASIATSGQGQSLSSAMQNLQNAIVSGNGISAALTAFQTAATNFNNSVAGNQNLQTALKSVDASMGNVTAQLVKENTNLSLAGVSLASPPISPAGSGQILAFASKLHSFGVDKLQLGHADVLNGAATDNLTGDAMKAAMLEGKNVAAMAAVGKTPPTVSNQTAALSDANASNIDNLINAYKTAKLSEDTAKSALNNATAGNLATATTNYTSAHDAATAALNNLQAAANSAGGDALAKTNAAIAEFAS
jgi:hypothetical protein